MDHEAAKLCRVSQQTIIRCFDSGELNGFRVPGSRFRRITRTQLLRFMKANDIPTDQIEGDTLSAEKLAEMLSALDGEPAPTLRPEVREAFDASWERNEEAYRYLADAPAPSHTS
jgi:excisionase family DNA binding protein